VTTIIGDEWEVVATHDLGFVDAATKTVASAIIEVERGSPGFPRIHAKRQARTNRLHRAMPDHGMIVAIVAQWLSAKHSQNTATAAKNAAQGVSRLADDVDDLRHKLSEIVDALRFAEKTEDGEDIAGYAGAATNAISEALPLLRLAQQAARSIDASMPTNAKGSAGVVGALRQAPPDEALAISLARYWRFCGLSLDGGEDGDGLDVVLENILGKSHARKVLTRARASLSIEISTSQ